MDTYRPCSNLFKIWPDFFLSSLSLSLPLLHGYTLPNIHGIVRSPLKRTIIIAPQCNWILDFLGSIRPDDTVHRVTSISLGHSSRHLSTLRRHRIIRDTYYRRTGRLSFLSSLNNANVIPRNEFSVPLRVVEEGLTSLCLRIPAMHVRARVFTHAMCLIIDSQRVQRATLIGLDNFVTSIFE